MIPVAKTSDQAFFLFQQGHKVICCETKCKIDNSIKSYIEAKLFFEQNKKKIRYKVRPIK